MPFEQIAEFFDAGFELPAIPSKAHPQGRAYYVPPPGWKEGLYLQAIMDTGESMAVAVAMNRAQRRAKTREPQPTVITAANKAILSDEEERHVYRLALGDAFDEMVADEVSWPVLKHAGMTAWLFWSRDEDSAMRYWRTFGRGKALDPTASPAQTSGATSPEDLSTPSPA